MKKRALAEGSVYNLQRFNGGSLDCLSKIRIQHDLFQYGTGGKREHNGNVGCIRQGVQIPGRSRDFCDVFSGAGDVSGSVCLEGDA